MKRLIFIGLVLISSSLFSQDQSGDAKSALELAGNILLSSNGISPVPAFSLGKPAIMTNLSLKRSRFSFTNQFNYGIDGKPWSSNNWFRFQFPAGKFRFRVGTNWSFYFKESTIVENNQTITIKRVNRYLENELAVIYQAKENITIQTMWWHDEGLDVDGVKRGDYYSLSMEVSKIRILKNVYLKLAPNIFYLNNKIPFSGLFVSNTASINYKESPFSLSFQVVQPIVVKPEGNFSWNVGLGYRFKN